MMRAPHAVPPALLVACAIAVTPANAGPPGFAFLEVPAGARASALGGAYASLGKGAEAAFWNPAALEATGGLEAAGSHYEMFERLRHDQFAVAGKLWGGGVSASLRAFYTEPLDERDELGNLIGSFGAHDLEIGLSFGRRIAPGAALGASAQVVRERIANSAATSYAFDLGAIWEPARLAGARMSLSAHNLGPSASFMIDGSPGAPVPLPAALHAGISQGLVAARGMSLRGAVESRLTRGRSGIGMIGGELATATGAALRAGLRLNDEASSLSVGAGYAFPSIRLDYAYVPFRLDLGDTHRVSFSARL